MENVKARLGRDENKVKLQHPIKFNSEDFNYSLASEIINQFLTFGPHSLQDVCKRLQKSLPNAFNPKIDDLNETSSVQS